MRGWLRKCREGGFDALKPRLRHDHGQSHALPQEVADLLVSIKDENPDLSVQLVIQQALASDRVSEGLQLAPSTVHRLLTRAGLMAKRPGNPTSKDHRRFSFEKAGDLWMSDVMHGPAVAVAGKKRKTYLIAFIDDATRVVPYAAFALSENTAAFLPVLKEAVLRRGCCRRLSVDNGAAFRSHHLAVVCAKTGLDAPRRLRTGPCRCSRRVPARDRRRPSVLRSSHRTSCFSFPRPAARSRCSGLGKRLARRR
jgi:putative transposase